MVRHIYFLVVVLVCTLSIRAGGQEGTLLHREIGIALRKKIPDIY
jgi:hypothetical protein